MLYWGLGFQIMFVHKRSAVLTAQHFVAPRGIIVGTRRDYIRRRTHTLCLWQPLSRDVYTDSRLGSDYVPVWDVGEIAILMLVLEKTPQTRHGPFWMSAEILS